ncbi:LOW QUALITY PROTEIN: Helitron helicase-like protein [Phytophthora palmivora]|uniref:ATP-dependent DNA helicase n=1 Tax=Phytophthora palmivora TaxID=4796 RepID=A0A2P4XNT9_9STRA|nr:LOW QUALITY PROTEIN: Helitron helicase-like protein [Phytophthora palmivora]
MVIYATMRPIDIRETKQPVPDFQQQTGITPITVSIDFPLDGRTPTSTLMTSFLHRELRYTGFNIEIHYHPGKQPNEGQREIYDQIVGATHQPELRNKSFYNLGRGTNGTLTRHQSCGLRVTTHHDFRSITLFNQFLPAVKKDTSAKTIDSCLKTSELWNYFQQAHLTENIRAHVAESDNTAVEVREVSEYLLKVGEKDMITYINAPRNMVIGNSSEEPDEDTDAIPGVIPKGVESPEVATDTYFANRTILTTTYAVVHCINAAVANREIHKYVLHSVNINGIPPYKLMLKQNDDAELKPNLGRCSGTHLRIVNLKDIVIHRGSWQVTAEDNTS